MHRNHSIKDFFKPTNLLSERTVLGSQLNENISNESGKLAVSCAERLGKSIKISSPARKKRKMPGVSPNKSPIIEAFLRGVKQKKTNIPNTYDSNFTKGHENFTSPKGVKRKLVLSKDSPLHGVPLNDQAVKKKLTRNEEKCTEAGGSFSEENSTAQDMDGMLVADGGSDSSTWSRTPETDILKDHGRGFGILTDILPWHQRLKSLTRKSNNLIDCALKKSVESCHSNKGIMESEQQSLSPVMASSSAASNISSQEHGLCVKNGPYSLQLKNVPVCSSQSIQSLVSGISSPEKTLQSTDNYIIKSDFSFSQTCPHGNMSPDQSRQQGLVLYGEKKKGSWHTGLSRCGEEVKQANSRSALEAISIFSLGVPHVEKTVLRTDETALSNVSLDFNIENKREFDTQNSYSPMHLSTVAARHCHPNNIEHSEEGAFSGVLPVKKSNQLSVSSPERTPVNHSHHLQSKPCLNCQSPVDLKLWPPLTSGLMATNCKLTSCHVEATVCVSECQGELNCKEGDFLDGVPSLDSQSPHSMDVNGVVQLQFLEGDFSSQAPPSPNRDMFSSCLLENRKANGKHQDSSDSDDSIECNLDSDEEDDMLKPLEEIMQIASKPPAATPEKAFSEAISSQGSITPSDTPFTALSPVSYSNSLERLLKEKEDSKRLDDLEKKLKGDIEQGMGIFSPFGEEDSNTDEEGTLSEEHRAFITKFSVVTDAIPDLHPGEEIFHLSNSGKLFNQHTLDLNNSGFIAQNEEEKLILSSGKKQQLILITQGFLSLIYRFVKCPVPILKWLFQMMSVHSDYIVSVQILNTLMDITVSNFSISDAQFKPWIPSVLDVAVVFVNMGVHVTSLFSLEHLQPSFKEDAILDEMRTSVSKAENQQVATKQAFLSVPETNIFNIVKFLGLCTAIYPEGYKDHEIMQLLALLFKIRLEKQLKQIPLVDFHCLFENLLKNIRDWDAKMIEISSCISELSSHHHNLLKLVHLVPNSIARGRQLRKHLSLVIISKLLDKKFKCLPQDNNMQMSVLCQYVVQMKPSTLTKKMLAAKIAQQQTKSPEQFLQAEIEQKAYYLTYSLLNLVNEASYSDACLSNERTFILKLCSALEKHVKCDIREDARLFYRTKVKDLVARIYGKWQELLHNSRPNKGKLHDYWEPVFECQCPSSKDDGQTVNGADTFPVKEEMVEMIQNIIKEDVAEEQE